jgi:hypothetical protein
MRSLRVSMTGVYRIDTANVESVRRLGTLAYLSHESH